MEQIQKKNILNEALINVLTENQKSRQKNVWYIKETTTNNKT